MATGTYDVVVIGGGPAGSAFSTLLAASGWSVGLVERTRFPRHRIGESLVPQVLEILDETGALPKVEAHGFLRKEGGVFFWGRTKEPWSFYFAEARQRYRYSYAYQVLRSEFDDILLRHAQSEGVDVFEDVKATGCVWGSVSPKGHGVLVKAQTGRGEDMELSCRIVADCSGREGILARSLCDREPDAVFCRNRAVFGYYRGARQLGGRDRNAIFCEAVNEGWIWNIPLHDGTNSVGVVTQDGSSLSGTEGRREWTAGLEAAIAKSRYVKDQLADADAVGDVRMMGDYAHRTTTLRGSGFVIVGHAGNFIDPVWSTGVFLTMSAARGAARAVGAWLRDGEGRHLDDYQRETLEMVGYYREFVKFFYRSHDASPESLFWTAYRTIPDAVDRRDAFVRLVSGRLGV